RESVRTRPRDRLAHEPLVESVRGRSQPRHRRQGERRTAAANGEVEKARRPSLRPFADDEQSLLVGETKQRVQRHHEATFGLIPTPSAGEILELGAQRAVDLARPKDFRTVALLL